MIYRDRTSRLVSRFFTSDASYEFEAADDWARQFNGQTNPNIVLQVDVHRAIRGSPVIRVRDLERFVKI